METKSKVKNEGLANLLKETDELIKEIKAGDAYMVVNGKKIDFSEWVTLKEYAKRHNLESINVVTNWIRRGIIPAEDVREYSFLNNLRMIRDKEYKK
ncbi:hypothetical protein [Spirosoma endbachense]|uniref:Uncharacterized protein n=1 Tax=Spirosoma endbachense TaxID=2666025 RepID=A0A6P1W2X6_9BACT|nr:hypothetical protein [Spirosoma endbachense]QHV99244.1 hypothetical protein GJR95_31395 [Spirosoma endbachense]